ncbi:MAG: elongation factor P [Oceanidesulfovibrio sp.]
MYSTKDFKGGLKIEWDGTPYEIVEASHYKPGKGGAFVRTKLRNMLTGGIVENNFRSGEKVGKPDMETRAMQFLYKDGDDFVFMDMSSYEQVHISEEQAGDSGGYLKDGQEAKVLFYNGQPLDLEIPVSTVLEVTETEPGVKGDTVSSTFKPAVMETGITIQVPLFINIGDRIKIDTRSGNYLGREGSA